MARELFERYRGSVAYVEVEDPHGTRHIGSAFHVGEGVFVTARHVVEDKHLVSVGTTETVHVRLAGKEAEGARTFLRLGDEDVPVHRIAPRQLSVKRGPFVALDSRVDIAVFGVSDLDPRTPHLELGSHLDDWLGSSDFVLSDALILGYPPVPLAREPVLVATRAEVVAQIDRYDAPHVHFVLSAMARGGFSGGVAYSERGFVLGVLTQSLLVDGKPEELGYLSVTSIEPIYACLADHKLLPAVQAEQWDGLWNSRRLLFCARGARNLEAFRVVAGIEVFDDGRQVWLDIHCEDLAVFEEVVASAVERLPEQHRVVAVRPGLSRLHLDEEYSDSVRRATCDAATAAADELVGRGFVASGTDTPAEFFST